MPIHFDSVVPAQEQVVIGDKHYVLREPSEAINQDVASAAFKHAKVKTNGTISGMTEVAARRARLVSACLFEVTDQGERPVPFDTVRRWRASVVKHLHDTLLGMMGEGDEESSKNSPSATPGTSE